MTRRRALLLALAVTALLAVVALAARGRPLGANGAKNSGLPMTFWDYAFTTVVIVIAASAIVSLGVYFALGRGGGRDLANRSQLRTALTLAILLAVCAIVAFVARHIDFHHLFHLIGLGAGKSSRRGRTTRTMAGAACPRRRASPFNGRSSWWYLGRCSCSASSSPCSRARVPA